MDDALGDESRIILCIPFNGGGAFIMPAHKTPPPRCYKADDGCSRYQVYIPLYIDNISRGSRGGDMPIQIDYTLVHTQNSLPPMAVYTGNRRVLHQLHVTRK